MFKTKQVAYAGIALILIIVSATLLINSWLHSDYFRRTIEHYMTALTGQTFSINGSVKVYRDEGWVIELDDATLVNSQWQQSDVFQVKHAEIKLGSLFSVFSRLYIKEISLFGSVLHLATNEANEANWDFLYNNHHRASWPYIARLSINGLDLSFANASRNSTVHYLLPELKLVIEQPVQAVSIVDKQQGPGTSPIQVNLSGVLGDIHFLLKGTVTRPYLNEQWLDVKLSANGSSFNQFSRLLHSDIPINGPYIINSQLSAQGRQFWLNTFSGKLSHGELFGDMYFNLDKNPRVWTSQLHFYSANAGDLIREIEALPDLYDGKLGFAITFETTRDEMDTSWRENLTGQMYIALTDINFPLRMTSANTLTMGEGLDNLQVAPVNVNCTLGVWDILPQAIHFKPLIFAHPTSTSIVTGLMSRDAFTFSVHISNLPKLQQSLAVSGRFLPSQIDWVDSQHSGDDLLHREAQQQLDKLLETFSASEMLRKYATYIQETPCGKDALLTENIETTED